MRVIPTDVYNEDGELVKIVFNNEDGEFVIQAVWDENDPNDEEHRVKFREWAYRFINQLDDGKYEVQS